MELQAEIKPGYSGYTLQGYAKSLLTRKEIKKYYQRLDIIPSKISTFIKRETIKEVYKYNTWNYYVVDINDNIWVLDY